MDNAPLETLEHTLGYQFRDPHALTAALVHRSAPNEMPEQFPASNERLEFLGDTVLDLIVAAELYRRFPDGNEGDLTRYKSALVSEVSLAQLARDISLGDYLFLGRGEQDTGGRDKPSILSDALEAVLGAVYLEGGLEAAQKVVLHLLEQPLATVRQRSVPRGDYKTALQEWSQSHGLGLPKYQLAETIGPDHARAYRVTVHIRDIQLGQGQGHSKREAERLSAETAMTLLTGPDNPFKPL